MLNQVCEYFSAFPVNQQTHLKRVEIECNKRSYVIYRYSKGTVKPQEISTIRRKQGNEIVEAAPIDKIDEAAPTSIVIDKQRSK